MTGRNSAIVLLMVLFTMISVLGVLCKPSAAQDARVWVIPPLVNDGGLEPLKGSWPCGIGLEIQQQDTFCNFRTVLDDTFLAHSYALRVKAKSEQLNITVNGQRLEVLPLGAPNGLFYRFEGSLLRMGENTIEIRSSDSSPLSIEELEAFSLVDTFEEVHFARAFVGPITWVQPPTDPSQDMYDVQHYDLQIRLNMASTVVDATLTMTAQSTNSALVTVPLDLNDNSGQMSVSWVDQGPSTAALPFTHNGAQDRVFITLPAAVPSGNTFMVRVRYGGTPAPRTLFGNPYVRTTHGSPPVPVIYTFSEPYGARHWWPCKDVPHDKATMDLRVTCPTAYSVVSNGKLLSIQNNGDGTHTYNWSETYPMATYLASIACTNYQASSGTYTALDGVTTMEVAHHLYPENYAAEAPGINGTLMVMDFFAETFGEYPFLTEKYYTATHSSGSGMEHQTATSMPQGNLAPDGLHRRNIHELAHMWFGDLITMGHFDHLWLNEGFATYCEALWTEFYSGTAAYHALVNGWTTDNVNPLVNPNADQFSGSLVYRKGAWVLHMLRHVVGDADFFQAVRNYVANPALRYGIAFTSDLQAEFEAQTGQDLDYFFDEWVYRGGRPSYQWAWSNRVDGSSNILLLYINQTQTGGAFVMPLDFRVTVSGGGTQTVTVFNDSVPQYFEVNLGSAAPTAVSFDPDNWVLKTASQVSFPSQPAQVLLRSVLDVPANGDQVQVHWQQSPEVFVTGYELYRTQDLQSWTLVADATALPRTTTSYVVSGLSSTQDYYFRIRAMSNTGGSGPYSDVYGCRPTSGTPAVLIVEGFDRWDTLFPGTSFRGVFYHGRAVSSYGVSFDTCDNSEVGATVNLGDYPVVIYVLGTESTADETFSSSEQTMVVAYLNSGGNLFVSGAEIGWDLGRSGVSSPSDIAFYNNYLKALYVGDDANTNQAQGTAASIFAAVSTFNFGTGVGDSYAIAFPDRLGTSGGSVSCLTYVGGTADTAAIQYGGTFKVVNLGFPFDTIIEESARNQIMAAALDFFGATSVPMWSLY